VLDEVSIPDRRALIRIFPALRFVGALRLAFDFRKLVIAAIGLALLQLGWSLLDRVGLVGRDASPDVFKSTWLTESAIGMESWSWDDALRLHRRTIEPLRLLATPLFRLLEPGRSWGEMLRSFVRLVWVIVVWGVCGGAIARIAMVQIAQMRQSGLVEGLRFAIKNAASLILAPLCPLLTLGFCAAFCALFGLLYRLPVVGPALAGIFLVVPLAAALVMALLVAGLAAGWPLLQAALAGGAEDALDALSRVFGYLIQRLGPFAAVLVLVWIEGMLGIALVELLAAGVIRLAHWSLGLGGPALVLDSLLSAPATPVGAVASVTHTFWLGAIDLVAHGWIYSFFWTAAAFLYLWLRHDVDGTPWTEIDPPAPPTAPTA
jgi:hypothetical protein